MADLKSVYFVSGEDDAKIDAWRSRVRKRAEEEGGAGALEAFDAPSSSPEEVASALATLTFGAARRYLLVDGVEKWKAGTLEPLERALADPPPDTVIVLVARGKAPSRLADAVAAAGGELHECAGPKPWEMPRWAARRAAELGLRLDTDVAKTLVAGVGTRPRKVLRELEKLAIWAHPEAAPEAEAVERLIAGEASVQAYDLADALAAGDRTTAFALAEELIAREERGTRLAFPIVRRLREVNRAVGLIEAGASQRQVASDLRMPPWAAKRVVGRARGADRDALERALCAFAEFEVDTRAGTGLDEDTAFSLTLARATA